MMLPAPSLRIGRVEPAGAAVPVQGAVCAAMQGTASSMQPSQSPRRQHSQQQDRPPRRIPQLLGGAAVPATQGGGTAAPEPRRSPRLARTLATQVAVLMDSDEEDWEAIDMLVAGQQNAQQASQLAAPGPQPPQPADESQRAAHPAALGKRAEDVPGPACKHGVPLTNCPRRTEHLADIKESLLSIMTRLLDEPGMPPQETSRLSAERQRLLAEQAALEAAPPLAGANAQHGQAPGAPPVPVTPAHGYSQAATASAILRKQSLSQTSQPGAPAARQRAGDAHAYQQGGLNGGTDGYSGASQPFSAAGGASGSCLQCGQQGHWARNCPNKQAAGLREGLLPGSCHSCGEAGHWASTCPQRGSTARSALGGIGGKTELGSTRTGDRGSDSAAGTDCRLPDPTLRGGGGDGIAGDAGPCRWQEGTNDAQWSRHFPWTPVSRGCCACITNVAVLRI